MTTENDDRRKMETPTSLYLVRIWRGKAVDGSPTLHGKLQHVVSGASSHFDGLASLPEALDAMMKEEAGALGPNPHIGSSHAIDGDKPDAS